MKKRKLIDKIVFMFTKKPEHYVRVKRINSLQDLRQIQYNKWCKAKGVYNGSFLPKDPDLLTESGKKGWFEEEDSFKDVTKKHRIFKRKSSGQVVDYHSRKLKSSGNVYEYEHYHWRNPNVNKKNDLQKYIDRYGNVCGKKTPQSHLAPLDNDYKYK